MNLIPDLEFRGLVYQATDLDGLAERLATGPITVYTGFDPTADSMTVGNLVPILLLRRYQLAGHKAIALAGGGTGLIGDPSGKSEERQLNTDDTVAAWTEKVKGELERFLDFGGVDMDAVSEVAVGCLLPPMVEGDPGSGRVWNGGLDRARLEPGVEVLHEVQEGGRDVAVVAGAE